VVTHVVSFVKANEASEGVLLVDFGCDAACAQRWRKMSVESAPNQHLHLDLHRYHVTENGLFFGDSSVVSA